MLVFCSHNNSPSMASTLAPSIERSLKFEFGSWRRYKILTFSMNCLLDCLLLLAIFSILFSFVNSKFFCMHTKWVQDMIWTCLLSCSKWSECRMSISIPLFPLFPIWLNRNDRCFSEKINWIAKAVHILRFKSISGQRMDYPESNIPNTVHFLYLLNVSMYKCDFAIKKIIKFY